MRQQPAIRRVVDVELPAHALDRLLDDGQAEAGAGGCRARRITAVERRGQLRELTGAMPVSVPRP